MDKIHNVGHWTAIVKKNGKAPQLFVNGIVPTMGEKPIFKLVPTDYDGFNFTQLILLLENGNLVDIRGNQKQEIEEYKQTVTSIEQYNTILILENSSSLRIIAKIDIIEEEPKKANKEKELVQTNIKGNIKIMTVPREERDSERRSAFIQFDNFSNIKGNIGEELLGIKVYAIANIANIDNVDLSEIVKVSGDSGDVIPYTVDDDKFTVIGTIFKAHQGYRFVGGTYRLTSMKENLKKLKNKRIFASGSFAQFHTEEGYFEAYLVEDYKIINSKNALNLNYNHESSRNYSKLINNIIEGSEITILKTFPPTLSIIACGENLTTGWENDFELSPYYYLLPPEDGIYEFNFIGTPPNPNDITLEVLSPCFANYFWNNFPKELKGVRIHTINNSIDLML